MKKSSASFKTYWKTHKVQRVLLIILLVVLLLFLAAFGFYRSKLALLNYSDGVSHGDTIDESDSETLAESDAMKESTAGLEEKDAVEATGDIMSDENVINILLIGTDERTTDGFSDNARGDSCLLLSLDKRNNAVKLVSFERGMGMPILDGEYEGQYDWLTHTFRYGGAALMMKEITECFKVKVDRYIRVNFGTFIKGIDAVGGVDIDLTQEEVTYFNTGNHENFHVGVNHLDGEQALGYARLREIDSDWSRIQRQRRVIQAAWDRVADLSVLQLNTLLDQIFPMVQTNLTDSEITTLLLLAPSLRGATAEQLTIPEAHTYGSMTGMGGRSMFAVDFELNSQALQEFVYGTTNDN
ncbi:MAG: LCP family protein [Gemmiger sp.]|uniref:LCP family protein n=1 Tax=Gemmiger sp. TaxID=2049027 RepID=UPI002E7A1C41|nr:LCP family protein [Gemmiger sp.]MEE0801567.1 LCP family protein [Gemmiger sp.]